MKSRNWVHRTMSIVIVAVFWTFATGVGSCNKRPYGINGSERGLTNSYTLAKEAGFTWVRIFFSWEDMQPTQSGGINFNALIDVPGHPSWEEGAEDMVNNAASEGAAILVTINKAPGWATGANQGTHYEAFMRAVVGHFKDRVHAWELWNQPNFHFDTAANYRTKVLIPGSRAVKETDPNGAAVVAPSLFQGNACTEGSPNVSNWLSADGVNLAAPVDVIGVHIYHSDTSYIRSRLLEASNLATQFNIPQVWLTEGGFGQESFACGVSGCMASVQASLIGACINLVSDMMIPGNPNYVPRFKRYFVFKLHDRDQNENCSYGLLDTAGNIKPRYNEVKAYNLNQLNQTWWQ